VKRLDLTAEPRIRAPLDLPARAGAAAGVPVGVPAARPPLADLAVPVGV